MQVLNYGSPTGPTFLLGRVRGVPICMHWSAPLGALFFGGFSVPGALAWLTVMLVHEAGHAVLAWRLANGVVGLSFHALGGECTYVAGPRRWSREIIAWGGVLAQLALFLLVSALREIVPIGRVVGSAALDVLTGYNLLIAAFNLLPVANLDGQRAWGLLGALKRSNVRRWAERRRLNERWGESRELQRKLAAMRARRLDS